MKLHKKLFRIRIKPTKFIAKINEACSLIVPGQYIDVNELELSLATKSSGKRAVSMDVNK